MLEFKIIKQQRRGLRVIKSLEHLVAIGKIFHNVGTCNRKGSITILFSNTYITHTIYIYTLPYQLGIVSRAYSTIFFQIFIFFIAVFASSTVRPVSSVSCFI